MRKNSNKYIILYIGGLVIFVAAILALISTTLKDKQKENVLIEKKGNILSSIGVDMGDKKSEYIEAQYAKYITSSFMINPQGEEVESTPDEVLATLDNLRAIFEAGERFPIFEAKAIDGSKQYVIPVIGNGLWGPIWGYVALGEDMNTIQGAVFDHQGETPGLGAELAHDVFYNQFAGKKIFDGDRFVSIALTKGSGSSKGNPHAVDAISGGTLTSNGIRDMLNNCLRAYLNFFQKEREKPKTEKQIDKDSEEKSSVNTETSVDSWNLIEQNEGI